MPTKIPEWREIKPHLKVTLFITGSFGVAWCFDLVLYSIAHIWHGKNPLRDEIGFGDDQLAPKFGWILFLEYLVVCALASAASNHIRTRLYHKPWCAAAIQAVEFIPAPYFSGKLAAYLSQFSGVSDLHQALYNLLAVAFAALVAQVAQDDALWERLHWHVQCPPWLVRFRSILAETLGFGTGVAWNFFLLRLFGPEEMNAAHILGLFGYLLVVALLSFRIAAIVEEHEQQQELDKSNNTTTTSNKDQPTLIHRIWSMLSFSANVVVAFTTVAFFNALLLEGWVGDILELVILILLAALLSAMVEGVDLESIASSYEDSYDEEQQQQNHHQQQQIGFGRGCSLVDMLVLVPCVWCCCPWIPVLWLLAGITPDLHLKEKWQQLIAFCLGLATSIQAAGILTEATGQLSTALNICSPDHCHWPWLFLVLQIALGVAVTAILLPLLGLISEPVEPPSTVSASKEARGEQQPLL